ncbi:hypothetical protein EDD18DRAFT_1109838 [Armillaria luteobubalina]|uniref:Uncharacterized protein n=1 Tax=Armillaria luteobubalina TaxID=153913 RepID=A0AA39PVL9_9AGAR|nr:hypothetical protein EDD18DRAFT_1109838 [Armillaria luteobubalina]
MSFSTLSPPIAVFEGLGQQQQKPRRIAVVPVESTRSEGDGGGGHLEGKIPAGQTFVKNVPPHFICRDLAMVFMSSSSNSKTALSWRSRKGMAALTSAFHTAECKLLIGTSICCTSTGRRRNESQGKELHMLGSRAQILFRHQEVLQVVLTVLSAGAEMPQMWTNRYPADISKWQMSSQNKLGAHLGVWMHWMSRSTAIAMIVHPLSRPTFERDHARFPSKDIFGIEKCSRIFAAKDMGIWILSYKGNTWNKRIGDELI